MSSTALLLYFAVLFGLTKYKYKVYGFASKMLLGLGIVVLALFIEAILGFRMNRIIDGNFDPVHIKSIQPQLNRLLFTMMAPYFIILDVGPCVFWIFAMKYWSVALKFELAAQEQDITSKTKLVDTLLFGGLIYTTVLALVTTILVTVDLHNYLIDGNRTEVHVYSIYFFLFAVLVSCLFLFDAFRRMVKTKI